MLAQDVKSPKILRKGSSEYIPGIEFEHIDFTSHALSLPFDAIHFVVLPNFSTPLDHHQAKECWVILKGSGLLSYDSYQCRVAEQDILYFQPNHPHQVFNDGKEPLVILSLSWEP